MIPNLSKGHDAHKNKFRLRSLEKTYDSGTMPSDVDLRTDSAGTGSKYTAPTFTNQAANQGKFILPQQAQKPSHSKVKSIELIKVLRDVDASTKQITQHDLPRPLNFNKNVKVLSKINIQANALESSINTT